MHLPPFDLSGYIGLTNLNYLRMQFYLSMSIATRRVFLGYYILHFVNLTEDDTSIASEVKLF